MSQGLRPEHGFEKPHLEASGTGPWLWFVQLKGAVAVVEAMGWEMQGEVVRRVCDREVAAYAQIYALAGSGGRIENVGNRFDFIRSVGHR